MALLAVADVRLTTLKARGVRVRALCNEACTIRASLRLGTRTIGRDTGRLSKAGVTALRLRPTAAGRRMLGKSRTRTLSIVATVTDPAGNRATGRPFAPASGP